MEIKSREDIKVKYPECRDDMSEEREKEFVNDCFSLYELEGFSKVFWSQGGDFKEYHNQPFEVTRRSDYQGCDLSVLPMWDIKFNDGFTIVAYPDEIIPREMKENGCKFTDFTE